MAKKKNKSLGRDFVHQVLMAAQELARLPKPGSRNLPVIRNISKGCLVDNLTNTLDEIGDILVDTGRVYVHGNAIKLEVGIGDAKRLVALTNDGLLEPGATQRLANIFICESPPNPAKKQFPPTDEIAKTALAWQTTLAKLPRINLFSNRPTFDSDFRLCNPGWNPVSGILVHGPAIEIGQISTPPLNSSGKALDRLPPHLRELLRDFCFASDADLANAVAFLCTGMLMPHFIQAGHPLAVLDGNQAGVGKTLLARVNGVVLDGIDPHLISYQSNDEEVQKRIVATLRSGRQSCLIFDNAKTKGSIAISSPTIEANSVAAEISLRILGVSSNLVRPNDLLWFVTMNSAKLSPDLVSRCIPIRFQFDGAANNRDFGGRDAIDFAKCHRREILAELAVMAVRWNQAGRPPSDKRHRLSAWVKTIGGIMEFNGLPEFLLNLEQAAGDFNTDLDELLALAEKAIQLKQICFEPEPNANEDDRTAAIANCGKTASELRDLASASGIFQDTQIRPMSPVSLGRKIGDLLGKYVGRVVNVHLNGREASATLRKAAGRANKVLYAFEIRMADPPVGEDVEGGESNKPTSQLAVAPAIRQKSRLKLRQPLAPYTGMESWDQAAVHATKPKQPPEKGNSEVW